jgi:DNA-binding transcriptional MerR regulator
LIYVEKALPAIPAKRYFTIGEVSELCGVKPYVLRYWEQEFTQLKPMKRRGNRRYYQHHEVLLIRRIRELLYDQGFTISGARNRLADAASAARAAVAAAEQQPVPREPQAAFPGAADEMTRVATGPAEEPAGEMGIGDDAADGELLVVGRLDLRAVRTELQSIRRLLDT